MYCTVEAGRNVIAWEGVGGAIGDFEVSRHISKHTTELKTICQMGVKVYAF